MTVNGMTFVSLNASYIRWDLERHVIQESQCILISFITTAVAQVTVLLFADPIPGFIAFIFEVFPNL